MAVPKKRRSRLMVKTRRNTQKLERITNIFFCEKRNVWSRMHHICNNCDCK